MTASAPASVTPATSGTANVIATSRMNPKNTDTTTDMTMPMAAVREAWRVSSLMCAEASNPVIVYCAISRPMPKTKMKALSENPELLIVSPNTKPMDWWFSGSAISTATMISTPIMCHQAENEFSQPRMLTPNRLTARCAAMITVKVRKMVPVSVPTTSGARKLSSAVMKIAPP